MLIRRGRTEHDADELLQEAWVRLARYEREQPVQQPEAFLMRAALNLSIDAHSMRHTHGEEVLLENGALVDTTTIELYRTRDTPLHASYWVSKACTTRERPLPFDTSGRVGCLSCDLKFSTGVPEQLSRSPRAAP